MHANSVECCDLKPYCCSDKRLLAYKIRIKLGKHDTLKNFRNSGK